MTHPASSSGFDASYFDGVSSKAHACTVRFDGHILRLVLTQSGAQHSWPLAELVLAVQANDARQIVLQLPGHCELHFSLDAGFSHGPEPALSGAAAESEALLRNERDALMQALRRQDGWTWLHTIERNKVWMVALLLVTAGLVFSSLRWGAPLAAKYLAGVLPESVAQTMGEQSMAILDKVYFSPSKLPPARQQGLQQQLRAYCSGKDRACPHFQLEFRDGGSIGANALALPNGTLVVTDQLVELAQQDSEIIAVLAHELGHIAQQHSTRLALQTIGVTLIVTTALGDLDSVADMGQGLPALLLQSGYSRDMESEADDYALQWLQKRCISPTHLATILARIDDHPSKTGLLDSHPGTLDRMEKFKQASNTKHCS